MDDKERLRLAKEALDSGSYDKETIEYIFPELREESEDERIRKDIIAYIEIANQILPQFQKDKWIAWLEKQGEQKHKIQPKFKIGDIIRFKGNKTLKGEAETHKIISYDNELYVFTDGTTDLMCEQDLYELVEQKPADKVEPKFNIGDKIIGIISGMQYYITEVRDDC